jgi:RNA polymerase sigma factor (sigma-70 family)
VLLTTVVADRSADRRALLRAFGRHDPAAVRAMYQAYGRLLFGVAHRVLGRHDLAEEAAQHAFLNAWRAAARIDVDRDPTAWLATIARRAAIDIHRRETSRPTIPLTDVAPADPAVVSLPIDVETLDAVLQVREALASLPEEEATIVRMHHLDGLTQREIAARLGLALGTVNARSQRAHRHLARLLGHLRAEMCGAPADSCVGG